MLDLHSVNKDGQDIAECTNYQVSKDSGWDHVAADLMCDRVDAELQEFDNLMMSETFRFEQNNSHPIGDFAIFCLSNAFTKFFAFGFGEGHFSNLACRIPDAYLGPGCCSF